MTRSKYIKVKNEVYKDETSPVPKKPIPTTNDYKKGTYKRYFIRRRDDHNSVMEIDKKQHDTLNKKEVGLNGHLYEGFILNWRVRGRLHDEFKGSVRTYPGVHESNQRFIEKLKKSFPQIENLLLNFSEHAEIEVSPNQSSITTIVEDHFHRVFIDDMGNGHTSEYTNIKNPNIKHHHEIRNFVIQEASDVCYPNCVTLYGHPGAPPHTHEIDQ